MNIIRRYKNTTKLGSIFEEKFNATHWAEANGGGLPSSKKGDLDMGFTERTEPYPISLPDALNLVNRWNDNSTAYGMGYTYTLIDTQP